MTKTVLFVSYDGLSDPLGQSQIMPYLINIAKHPRKIHLISFEKKERLHLYKQSILRNFNQNNITWHKLNFTKSYYKFGKIFDFIKLLFCILFVTFKYRINLYHFRGFLPSLPILFIRMFRKITYIYDSRGLWVDERLDNFSLNRNKILDNYIYLFLKYLEKKVFVNSDYVIVLTRKAKKIIKKYRKDLNISIIPCCADYNFFDALNINLSKENILEKYKIPKNKKIILYSGSTKGVYLLDEMLFFFKNIMKYNENYIFIILSNDLNYTKKIILEDKYKTIFNNIILKNVLRNEMPYFYYISDLMISFINPTFARKASFPTKIAECFALDLPILINKGVGDLDLILRRFDIGTSFHINSKKEFQYNAKNIINTINKKENCIRKQTSLFLDLPFANTIYKDIYFMADKINN